MKDDELKLFFDTVTEKSVEFRSNIRSLPTAPTRSYAECLEDFGGPVPETGQKLQTIVEELIAKSEGGLLMPASPRFFGWVMGASHPAGVAADYLMTALGQVGALSSSQPAIEAVAQRWLLDLLDLPRESSIGFVTGATVANFTCLAAARGDQLRKAGWDGEKDGLFGAPPITVLIGADAHSTVFMALQYLGLGHSRVVKIATDDQGRVLASDFARKIGKVTGPAIVILQAGQINTGAFDPFAEIIPLAKKAGAWVHVDGAFGLWARACSGKRDLTEGIELADSWATDGHKWLQAPYDSGFAIIRDEIAHKRAMSIAASYLPTARDGMRSTYDYTPELSRRARGTPVWAIIKALGRSGIDEMVERHCRVARQMAGALAAEPGIAIENDVVLNQVAVRFGADLDDAKGDRLTKAVIDRIQADRLCFAGGAEWRGRQIMRISVTSFETDEEDGKISVGAMIAAHRKIKQQLLAGSR
jgi:glutamate/tyrosine decarboxylase-like PLP-dependent enzyme